MAATSLSHLAGEAAHRDQVDVGSPGGQEDGGVVIVGAGGIASHHLIPSLSVRVEGEGGVLLMGLLEWEEIYLGAG